MRWIMGRGKGPRQLPRRKMAAGGARGLDPKHSASTRHSVLMPQDHIILSTLAIPSYEAHPSSQESMILARYPRYSTRGTNTDVNYLRGAGYLILSCLHKSVETRNTCSRYRGISTEEWYTIG
jgi:hypothetical protein